jgi:phage major head subunit gpT-like protein
VTISTGGQNTLSNAGLSVLGMPQIELIVAPELQDDAATWYLAAVSESSAPIVYQETEALEVIPKIDPKTDDNMFHNDELLWLAKGRAQFGFGDARRIVRCN